LSIYRTRGAQHANPGVEGPAGHVWVGSDLADGTLGGAAFSFGGDPVSLGAEERSVTEITERLLLRLPGGAHQLQLGGSYSAEHFVHRTDAGQFGAFEFGSLGDLAAGHARRYTRTLGTPTGRLATRYGAAYLGDEWAASDALRVIFGLRAELRGYPRARASAVALDSLFGLRDVPRGSSGQISPRTGFTYFRKSVGSEFSLRGGVGLFRGSIPTRSLAAQLVDELAGSRVECIGAAVPAVHWNDFLRDRGTIPTSCADDSGVVAISNATLTGFASDYAPPRVWHSSLSGSWHHLATNTHLSVNLSFSQGSGLALARDRNLGEPYFTLTSEGGRPVYVPVDAIDPASGQTELRASRRVQGLGIVREISASGRSSAATLSVGLVRLTPLGILQAYYTWSRSRDEVSALSTARGGEATTGANPRAVEWAASDFEQRHAFQASLDYSLNPRLNLAGIGRLQSGAPFTPQVDVDVNGDGLANDRAFIFDPRSTDSPELAHGMDALLGRLSGSGRSCLLRQMGKVAGRNSCRTSWTPFLDLQLTVQPGGVRDRRLMVMVTAQNIAAGADLLLHGAGALRGWGQYASPDPVLLRVRGFDRDRAANRYEVNPNFGPLASRAPRSWSPFGLRVQVRVAVGADPVAQALVASFTSMRSKLQPAELRTELLRSWRNDPAVTLALADSLDLELSADQRAALQLAADSAAESLGRLAQSLASAIASLDDAGQQREMAELARQAQAVLDDGFALVRRVLTPSQRTKLPGVLLQAPRAVVSVTPQQPILMLPDL